MRAIRRSPTETRRSKTRHVVCLVLSEWVEQNLLFLAWNEAVCENLVIALSMEQRLAIKFCIKVEKKSAIETLQMVNAAYGDQALTLSNVFWCVVSFKVLSFWLDTLVLKFFPLLNTFLELFRADVVQDLTSLISVKRISFIWPFIRGNRKKSHGARSDK